MSVMATLPKVVKLGTSQVRQTSRMRIQVQDVEDVIKVFATEKQKDKPITEDKKADQTNDEKKSPARKKVKMRKRRQWKKEDDLSHQLREEQEVPKVKNEKVEPKQHEYLEQATEKKSERENKPNKQNFKMQTKACSRNEIPGLHPFRISRLQTE